MPVDVSAAGEEAKKSALGSTTASKGPGPGGGNTNDGEDITRTNDIFGLNDKGNTDSASQPNSNATDPTQMDPSQSNVPTSDPSGAMDPNASDPTAALGSDGTDMDGDGQPDDNGEGMDDGTSPDATTEEVDHTEISSENKEKLRDKMILLYQTIRGNIDLLNDYNAEHDNISTIKDINNIIDNLTEAIKVLYKALTSDINKTEYADLLKTFIGAQKVYDISISMIDNHFTTLKKIREENDKKSKKMERKPHRILTTFQ